MSCRLHVPTDLQAIEFEASTRPPVPLDTARHEVLSLRIPPSSSDVIPSANYGDRGKGRAPDMIVLHYTGMTDAEVAIAQL